MKILHINQSDISGGAAIAGYRLHQGLLNQNIDSRLLVKIIKTDSELVATIPKNKIDNYLSQISWRIGLNYINYISSFGIPKHRFYQEADCLNLHNLHGDFFSYLAIPKLTREKPAIFTLHDMWSFTGHCAYSYDCDRWQSGCGNCPYPDIYPKIKLDNTDLEWKLKDWTYSRSNLTIVTISKWLTEQVKKSMLNRFNIHHIPNGIDIEAYQPLNKEECRHILGIGRNQKVLMFGAVSLKDERKGSDLLIKSLQQLPSSLKSDILLLTLGEGGEKIAEMVGIKTLSLGYVSSDRLKSIAFSASDLFVFPTRADNLPLVLQESMACGTPMVSFNVGGVSDLVRPEVTGHLAEPENIKEFCDGIVRLLEDSDLRANMSTNCRAIAINEYSLKLQAKRYIELYKYEINLFQRR